MGFSSRRITLMIQFFSSVRASACLYADVKFTKPMSEPRSEDGIPWMPWQRASTVSFCYMRCCSHWLPSQVASFCPCPLVPHAFLCLHQSPVVWRRTMHLSHPNPNLVGGTNALQQKLTYVDLIIIIIIPDKMENNKLKLPSRNSQNRCAQLAFECVDSASRRWLHRYCLPQAAWTDIWSFSSGIPEWCRSHGTKWHANCRQKLSWVKITNLKMDGSITTSD